MTNQDIKEMVARFPFHTNNTIKRNVAIFIKAEYKRVDENDKGNGKWYKVHNEGDDCKYGTYMIDVENMLWRFPDMAEFYGSAPVD